MPRTAASVPFATRALVLRVRPLGEKDRVLTLLSPEIGKFAAIARGARSPKGKLSALSQPFVLARFGLATGKTFDIVTQAQIEAMHAGIVGDVLKVSWAALACECADHAPDRVPDPDAFAVLEVFLGALDEASDSSGGEAAGLWFGAQWLEHLGYAPTIGHCVACERKLDASDEMWFGPRSGGTLCALCRGQEPSPEKVAGPTMRALHRLSRSRRPPRSLVEAPFELDERASAELGRCVLRALAAHSEGRLRSLALLLDERAHEGLRH